MLKNRGEHSMIRNPVVLQSLRAEWESVRLSQAMVKANTMAALSHGMYRFPITHSFADHCHGLTLLFAFSVFEKVLVQLRDEGCFACSSWMVGKLMAASETLLPWADYALVTSARDARNGLAHDKKTLPRTETWMYINAIEVELIAWGVLPGPVSASYTISRAAAK